MSDDRFPSVEDSPQIASETVSITPSAIFTPAQVELLNAMAWIRTDADVLALKYAISEFFAQRADEAMEQLWADGTWNEQTLKNLRGAHYRTPYEKR